MGQVIEVENAGGYGITTSGFNWYIVTPEGKTVTRCAHGRKNDAERAARCAGNPEYRQYMMARSAGYSDFKHGRTYVPQNYRGTYGYEDGWHAAAEGEEF